tara:strand:- start:3422 stop:4561 length:1140 start_codon:yes stop_codon:yes gene_type:complete
MKINNIFKNNLFNKFKKIYAYKNEKIFFLEDISLNGGVQRLVLDICKELNDPILTIYISKSLKSSEEIFRKYTNILQISILELILIGLFIRLIRSKVYIIHSHLSRPFYLSFLIPSFKRIYTEHNTWNKRRNILFCKYIDPYFYKNYDYVVCISKGVRTCLVNFIGRYKNDANLITINNWSSNIFDIDFENIKKLIKKRNNKFKNKKMKSIMIASFCDQKKQRNLLKLLDKFNFLEITFVGEGKYLNDFIKEVDNRKLSSRVICKGLLPSIKILELLKQNHLYLHSVEWEGFGIAVLEAMKLGLPVITSDVIGLREVINDKSSMVKNFSSKKCHKIIENLYSNSDYYFDKSIKSFQNSQRFSLKESISKYKKIYTITKK